MLSGPQNMPKFGDGQLTSDEKRAIITFIQNNKETIDPGGYAAGGFGPAPEGLIAFLVGHGRHRRGDAVDGVKSMSERQRANHQHTTCQVTPRGTSGGAA